jgi:hypothetical protein
VRPGRKPRPVVARAVGGLFLLPEAARSVAALLWARDRAAAVPGAVVAPGAALGPLSAAAAL